MEEKKKKYVVYAAYEGADLLRFCFTSMYQTVSNLVGEVYGDSIDVQDFTMKPIKIDGSSVVYEIAVTDYIGME